MILAISSSVLAAAVVIAQGFAVWGFLRFVKSFGAYTESQQAMTRALLHAHESNLALHEQNISILQELRAIHRAGHAKEVA
jgi:hypothetical protein